MGASLAAWNPPDDVETPLTKEEIRRVVGEEHFSEEIFSEMAVENDWITSAEFLLILSEFIDVDTFFIKELPPEEPANSTVTLAPPKKNTTRFKTSADLVKAMAAGIKTREEAKSQNLRSGISIKATVQKIRSFFAKKQIVIPEPPALENPSTESFDMAPPGGGPEKKLKMEEPKDPPTRSESILMFELKRSRSQYATWGKEVIHAIDADCPARLIRVFKTKKHLGAQMGEQTTRRSYGGYAWTVWMHKYLGDTALHIAIKQQKVMCVHALLISGADPTIKNHDGFDANDLAVDILSQSIPALRQDSEAMLIGAMHPRDYCLLPDSVVHRHLAPQAWNLMQQGRCEYEVLPAVLTKSRKLGGSHCSETMNSLDDASVGDHTASSLGGGGLLSPSLYNNQRSVVSQLSHDTYSTMSAGNRQNKHMGSVFCFNDVTDVVEILTRQSQLLVRLDREQRLQQSGLSLLAADRGDEGSASATVSGVAQRMIVDAHKSLSSFATLQKVLTADTAGDSVKGSCSVGGGASDQWKTCLDMPYRHISKLSTRSNLIHMNIGDEGIMRIAHALPGNTLITDIVLANARITTTGLKHLCDAMRFMPCLRYLDLSQNCIDGGGAAALAEVLGNNETMMGEFSSVEKITLMGNRVTATGAQSLLDALPTSKVSYLNLCRNRISSSEIATLKSIAAAIESSRQEKLSALQLRLESTAVEVDPEDEGGQEVGDDTSQDLKSASLPPRDVNSVHSGGSIVFGTKPSVRCAVDEISHLSTPKTVIF